MTILPTFVFFTAFYLKILTVYANFWSISKVIQSRYTDQNDFRLICPKDYYVSGFESEYSTNYYPSSRIFKLRCTSLPPTINQNHCHETWLSEPTKKFQLLCNPHYYMVGLRGVPGFSKDTAFRVFCCTSYLMDFDMCKNGPYSEIFGSFRKSLSSHESFFTGVSSTYDRKSDDRAFSMQYCKTYPNLLPRPNIINVPFFPRAITTAPFAEWTPPLPLPTRKATATWPPTTSTDGENINELTEEDLDIIIIPSSNSDDTLTLPKNQSINIPLSVAGETTPFKNFNILCSTGHAIRTLTLRKVQNGSKVDLTFILECHAIPYSISQFAEKSRRATFIVAKDGSVQSPCDYSFYEYLCGLIGVFGKVRRLAAYCCSIDNLAIRPYRVPLATVPSIEGSIIKAEISMQHFIGNLDQISDGSFVAHLYNFESVR